jgi:hypothetical protein
LCRQIVVSDRVMIAERDNRVLASYINLPCIEDDHV